MSVTGVLLTYEKQIIAWADTRNYRVTPPSAGASRLPAETLLAKAKESRPSLVPTTFTLRSDASMPAAIGVTGGRTVYVNPYTGDVLGEDSRAVRDFFRVVTDWHRWLGASGENRATARAITGACNLGFLFLVVSGWYIWWPRNWSWSQVRNVIWFKRGLPGKARDFNWHNTIGYWSLAPLFFIVLSAVVISYTWAGNLVYRLAGENPPAPPQRAAPAQPGGNASPLRGGSERGAGQISFDGLDQLFLRAEQQVAGWQSISLRLPSSPDAPAAFTIDQGNGGQPQKRAQLTLDRKSGEVVRWEPFSSLTTGRRMRSILRFAHTGEVAGVGGQTIAGVASLGACFLVYTGLALSLRRFRAWLARRSKESAKTVSPLVEEATEG
jgi:uncharacterized iron-regulated membrane protein